jgi:alkanesulfonate monooxygenase SsuD/methylene tetrahydromethanopterin reductase-like flavin-dependent oxidoreductase (luciferase family)
MYWTLELASKLEDAPWPASKDELIDYATRSGAPMEVIENLEDLEDDGGNAGFELVDLFLAEEL